MKKLKKLQLKKVTLKNLDEPQLDTVAGGLTTTGCTECPTSRETCLGCSSIYTTCADVC
jgi:natural product precursor